MPSFTKIAFSLLALSASVFAAPTEGANGLEKRVLNSSLDFSAISNLEKRAAIRDNIGATCKRNKKCYSNAPLATAYCHNRRCDIKCKGNSVRSGRRCINKPKPKACIYNASCVGKVNVPNRAHAVCALGKCTYMCNGGFHDQNGKCAVNGKLCGGVGPPNVSNGFSLCVNGKWQPQCSTRTGFVLHQRGGQLACIRTDSDPANCGKVGNVCPAGYNGLGMPRCFSGQCSLDCGGLKTRTTPSGDKYCSKA